MLNQLVRPIVRNVTRNGTRSSSSKVEVKYATINDLHSPCGPWKDHYEARQKVYNTQLIAGVSLLIGTITFLKTSGIVFFNFNPPEEPTEQK
nr:PREDICTED: uncharacterized protein LOC105668458 [Linepithema humile]